MDFLQILILIVGLLATLAAPVLVVDNFLALNVLLQSAVRRRRP